MTHALHSFIWVGIRSSGRMSTGIQVFIIGQHGSVIDMKAGNSWKTKFEDKSALLLALGTEQQQWWRNFRWLQQQQQLPKKQQGLMSRWQRLMEIQVAGRIWLHQLIRRRIGQCLLVAHPQCDERRGCHCILAESWKQQNKWVGVILSNQPQDYWAGAQMMQITTCVPLSQVQ